MKVNELSAQPGQASYRPDRRGGDEGQRIIRATGSGVGQARPPGVDEGQRIIRATGPGVVQARPPGMNAPAIELRRLKTG